MPFDRHLLQAKRKSSIKIPSDHGFRQPLLEFVRRFLSSCKVDQSHGEAMVAQINQAAEALVDHNCGNGYRERPLHVTVMKQGRHVTIEILKTGYPVYHLRELLGADQAKSTAIAFHFENLGRIGQKLTFSLQTEEEVLDDGAQSIHMFLNNSQKPLNFLRIVNIALI